MAVTDKHTSKLEPIGAQTAPSLTHAPTLFWRAGIAPSAVGTVIGGIVAGALQ